MLAAISTDFYVCEISNSGAWCFRETVVQIQRASGTQAYVALQAVSMELLEARMAQWQ
jgi:hypothetical protein